MDDVAEDSEQSSEREIGMNRSGWLSTAAVALVAFYLGKSLGPARIVFPDPKEGRTAEEMESEVGKALAEPRAFVRASALIRLFEGLTNENVSGAAHAIDSRASENDPVDLQMFLTAWAHLDPVAALQEVQRSSIQSRKELGLRVIMREWAASGDTLAAGNYFDTLTDPDQRRVVAGPLVRGWALSGDVDGALALARRLFEIHPRWEVIDGLVRGVLHGQGAGSTLRMARSLNPQMDATIDPPRSGEFDQKVILTTLDLAGRDDPKAATVVYDAFAGLEAPPAWLLPSLAPLADQMARSEPEAAIEWLLPKTEGPERSLALMDATGTWADRDFDAAWAWFEKRNPSAHDPKSDLAPTESDLLAGLLRWMAKTRPTEAARWSILLRPESNRIETFRRVAYFWSRTNAKGADEWISTLQLDPTQLALVREAAEWGPNRRDELAGERRASPDGGN